MYVSCLSLVPDPYEECNDSVMSQYLQQNPWWAVRDREVYVRIVINIETCLLHIYIKQVSTRIELQCSSSSVSHVSYTYT